MKITVVMSPFGELPPAAIGAGEGYVKRLERLAPHAISASSRG